MDYLIPLFFLIGFFIGLTTFAFFGNYAKIKKWFKNNCSQIAGIGVAIVLVSSSMLLIPTSDEPPGDEPDSPAYDYWYAPPNSFGIKETKSVNWSHFKSLFNAHTDWILEYKRYSYSDWTEGNEYLSVDKTWNETGFWKINLTFTAPVDVYEARFTFACDLVVLDYVEKDGYEIWLNYSANETEVYNMMFNWSDLKQYEGIYFNKGVIDDFFWFRFGKQGIPKGEYVFDPSFGYTDTPTKRVSFNDDIIGSAFVCPTNCNADNMSFFIDRFDTGEIVKCIIYNNSTKELVADTETETGGTLDDVWLTLDFTESPSLNSGVEYLLCVWADSAVSAGLQPDIGIYYKANYIWSGADPDPENPLTVDFSDTYILGIYCSYTEAGGEPENNIPSSKDEAPTNNTDCVSYVAGGITCSAVVYDNDGDDMNVTWWSNSSGSWKQFGVANSSVANNTNISMKNANFTTAGTTYYWNIIINDGEDGEANDSYYFKICENDTSPEPPQYNITIRNDGIDYFVWLGENTTAWNVSSQLTGFDEDDEYIGIWDAASWDSSNGSWTRFNGDKDGTNFSINTFDVVQIYLTDSGTQEINMYENESWNYTNSKTYTVTNTSVNKGFNYNASNKVADTFLSAINTSLSLPDYYWVALWNRTSYSWQPWISGFWETDVNVEMWDVVEIKTDTTRTWTT